MKAPSAGFRILRADGGWVILDTQSGDPVDGRVVWRGTTFKGARNAHYRLAIARITGKPVSAAQARRAGNP